MRTLRFYDRAQYDSELINLSTSWRLEGSGGSVECGALIKIMKLRFYDNFK